MCGYTRKGLLTLGVAMLLPLIILIVMHNMLYYPPAGLRLRL